MVNFKNILMNWLSNYSDIWHTASLGHGLSRYA